MKNCQPQKMTTEQQAVFDKFRLFISGNIPCFILRGSAGTGKTTLIRYMALYLMEIQREFVALTPTGHASRVLTQKTGISSSTIHSHIYNFEEFSSKIDEEGCGPKQGAGMTFRFKLKQNSYISCVYIIDEASMVSDSRINQDFFSFGSGKLLSDLVEYSKVKIQNSNAKFVFIGDHCQLPPIGMNISPALDEEYLRKYHHLENVDAVLNTVIRHGNESAILAEATKLREQIDKKKFNCLDIKSVDEQIIRIMCVFRPIATGNPI